MKKFRDLKVGDSIAIIKYELSQGDWGLTIIENEIIKINKRRREFELPNRFVHPERLNDTHIVLSWGVIQCPNDKRNINFAQKMLLAGIYMHRQRVYHNLQQLL